VVVVSEENHIDRRQELPSTSRHTPSFTEPIPIPSLVAAIRYSRLLTHSVTDFRCYGRLIEVLPLVQP
jgi:hypothetical protein